MNKQTTLSWRDVHRLAANLVARQDGREFDGVYGVPRGGNVPAAIVADRLNLPQLDKPTFKTLIVDDLIDSGATRDRFVSDGHRFDALLTKQEGDGWIVFPWEQHEEATGPTDAVRRLLQFMGENPERDGLLETPARVVKALTELTEGYQLDPVEILSKTFEQAEGEQYEGVVVSRDIPFTSLCEHHLLPFTGTASVAYIPNAEGRIVGLSKLARTVEAFARRLQVQERMTSQVADAIELALQPDGVAVVVTASHSCQEMRGIRKVGASMVTSEMRGLFREDAMARGEVLDLLHRR